MTAKPKTSNLLPAGSTCRCGCTEPVGKKSSYKPGHDARHASAVAQAVHETHNLALLKALPSAALQAKAQRKIDRLAAPKPTKTTEVAA